METPDVTILVHAFRSDAEDHVLCRTWIERQLNASSQFALIPNASPSGNFTKVTQRIPLRIDLKGNSKTLRPGMMVEVAIDGG